jgi:ribosomal protein S18 acetylase RimI-like enzyme
VEIALDLLVENRERVEDTIRLALRSDAFKLFIVETDGMVMGFLMLELKGWNKDLAQIYWMAVRWECQRKGYGSTLIKDMENYAKEKGVRKVFVRTNSDNKIAIPFYVKNRYKPEGLLKDCLILGKHL